MKCNNRCYRLLTVSRNRIHSHVDRRMCIQFPYIMRFLIQSINVGLIIFFFFFTLDKWHLSPFYHQQLSRNPQILQVRHEFDMGQSNIISILRRFSVVRSYLKTLCKITAMTRRNGICYSKVLKRGCLWNGNRPVGTYCRMMLM